MFNSGFAEATESVMSFSAREAGDGASPPSRLYADSDDEDDHAMLDTDDDQSMVDFSDGETAHSRIPTAPSVLSTNLTEDESDACFVETDTTEPRNVRQKITHPSSPRQTTAAALPAGPPVDVYPARPMTRVVVRDASYSAYRAVLYYVGDFRNIPKETEHNSRFSRSTPTISFSLHSPLPSSPIPSRTSR